MPTTTIRDVAKLAGCSAMTVSNVLNRRTHVRPDTVKRVREAIHELEYQPSQWARNLARRRTAAGEAGPLVRRFGCVLNVPSRGKYSDPYFGEVLESLEKELNERNYTLSFIEQWSDLAGTERVGELINPENIDVLVLLECEELLGEVRKYIENIVVMGNFSLAGQEFDYVSCDMLNGGRMATEYLLELGHRRIAYVGPALPQEMIRRERETGYTMAMLCHADHPAPWLVRADTQSWQDVLTHARELLVKKDRPTAIFAHSDISAAAVIKAAGELSLNVPDDLSVVGFNDDYLAELTHPALTTVRVDKVAIGRIVAQCGVDRLKNPHIPPRLNLVPGELIVRESCAPPSDAASSINSDAKKRLCLT